MSLHKIGFVPPDIFTKRILRNLSSFLKYTILGKKKLFCGFASQNTDLGIIQPIILRTDMSRSVLTVWGVLRRKSNIYGQWSTIAWAT